MENEKKIIYRSDPNPIHFFVSDSTLEMINKLMNKSNISKKKHFFEYLIKQEFNKLK